MQNGWGAEAQADLGLSGPSPAPQLQRVGGCITPPSTHPPPCPPLPPDEVLAGEAASRHHHLRPSLRLPATVRRQLLLRIPGHSAIPPNGQMDTEARWPLLARCERRGPPAHPSQWPSQGPRRHGDHRTEMHFRPACVSPAATACPARALARPSAGPPLTYCARLGLCGAPPGVHDSLSSGFNVLYLFGADRAPIKGWKWLWLCLRGPGSGWEAPVALRSRCGRRGVPPIFWGHSH